MPKLDVHHHTGTATATGNPDDHSITFRNFLSPPVGDQRLADRVDDLEDHRESQQERSDQARER
jgi:hypothetical protein